MKSIEIGGIQRFDPNGDVDNVGFRWQKWPRGFELYSSGERRDEGRSKESSPFTLSRK